MNIKFDGFLVGLFTAIVVAYFFPQLVLWQQGAVLSTITTIGVMLIFFFYGIKLSIQEIRAGLRNWKLHLLVQASTFLIFPLLVLCFYPFVQSAIAYDFWLSFFFLAALPSTVSSSVVMVSMARGNIPAAIFNASISGLIGVLVTPLWMRFFLNDVQGQELTVIYSGLLVEIIIPVVVGLLLQPYLGKWGKKYSSSLANFDKCIILLIVYSSFAESFSSGVFSRVSTFYLLAVAVGVLLLFVLSYTLLGWLTRALDFPRQDAITALFCGSKKSLTHGSVFGKFIFSSSSSAGLYFLPLMLYHALQLFIITMIAQRYGRR